MNEGRLGTTKATGQPVQQLVASSAGHQTGIPLR